ncbi:hypothetical protein [Nocardia sp. NPDC057455]|uniref:hypothetical protein n=1 Tax=Nocardia sp. NPDC057455 TaxID=3346138 RepID=UPI00366CDF0A
MSEVVIEVSVPQAADIAAAADPVDVVADPAGATVLVVPTPGPPSPLTSGELAQITDDAVEQVLAAIEPPVNLVLWFENQIT